MAHSDGERLKALTRRLLEDGYADNEADATVAAIRIIVTAIPAKRNTSTPSPFTPQSPNAGANDLPNAGCRR